MSNPTLSFIFRSFVVATVLVAAACGGQRGAAPIAPGIAVPAGRVGPASFTASPMALGNALPASSMIAGSHDHRVQMAAQAEAAIPASSRTTKTFNLTFTYVPSAASQVVVAPDGTLYALSTGPAGPDKSIWHYASGTWTNLPGAAMKLAMATDGSLWAMTSYGGLYHYVNGNWPFYGGPAQDLAIDNSGNLFVVIKGGGADNALWEYSAGGWRQINGYGARVMSQPDISLYVLTSSGAIYNSASFGPSYVQCAGSASDLAPLYSGAGFYALAHTGNLAAGALLSVFVPQTANDCRTGSYYPTNGFATQIATNGKTLAIVGTDSAIYTTPIGPAPTPTPPPQALPNIPYGPANTGWGPYSVANAFQFPVQSLYDGTGITVAIVGDYPASLGDVQTYAAQFGVHGNGTYQVENVGPGSSMTDTGGLGEATLDVETMVGLAPGATIIFYSLSDLSGQSFLNAYNQIVNDNYARVVSISFGGCENSTSKSIFDPVLAQGAAKGIDWVASAGDQGDECYTSSGFTPGVNFPASDPNVIGVGGTETYQAAINNTLAWNDTDFFAGQGATGGGVSTTFALPQYQQGLSGVASTSFRNVPDIAMPAVWTSNYLQGQWISVGGTSWSAPQIAAMVAELLEYCNVPNGITPPDSIFYYAFAQRGYADFIDVTNGNNRWSGDPVFYSATSGFDNVSGIGLPLAMPIAQTICPNRVLVSALRAPRGSRIVETPLSAAPRVLQGVPNVRGLADLGKRDDGASTSIAIVLRATETLAQDEATVVADLASHGFTIGKRYENHLVVNAQAPASAVAAYFQTQFNDFTQGSHGRRYANTSALVVPPGIAPYVNGVLADNLIAAVPLSHHLRRPFSSSTERSNR